MKIIAIVLCRDGPGLPEPVLLTAAYDLSSFGFFARSGARESVHFFSRTFVRRTEKGTREDVTHEGHVCHIYCRHDGLCGVVVSDAEYPTRVAHSLISSMMAEFTSQYQNKWENQKQDFSMPCPALDEAIVKYQNPAEADKLMKIQKDLDATVEIMHKNLDAALRRGEKLDTLVNASHDISAQSKLFMNNAGSMNKCCIMM